MPSKKEQAEVSERLNLTLTPELARTLTNYCIKWAGARGKMPTAMKTKVGRIALEEWLEKHADDFTFNF
jgi:hypothetical protein